MRKSKKKKRSKIKWKLIREKINLLLFHEILEFNEEFWRH